jgi:DNA-binding XRE family transcriptional regulator
MNNELISIWNRLPSQEKMAFGDTYISHDTNLRAWDKPFNELSPLKQKRVLDSVEDFSKVKFHGVIGSGVDTKLTFNRQRYDIGQQIKEIRKAAGITQEQLAGMCGLRQQHIARIEAGKHSFGIDQYLTIIQKLGYEIEFKKAAK